MKRISLGMVLLSAFCLSSFGAADEFSSKTIQIGMIVSDMEQSLHFYKEIIGMVQVEQARFDVDADFGRRAGLTDNLPLHVEVLKLGLGRDATQLKLISFGSRAKKQENRFIHDQTGVQYLTFNVVNLAPIVERIKANQIPLLGETPIELGEQGFVVVQDPDGTFVELIGPMEIIPPTQYQIMKEQSNFDKYKKEVPYRTPSRSASSEKPAKKFDFFGLFGSKKEAKSDNESIAKEEEATATATETTPVQQTAPSQDKATRDKFKKFKKETPYSTPSRQDGNRFLP